MKANIWNEYLHPNKKLMKNSQMSNGKQLILYRDKTHITDYYRRSVQLCILLKEFERFYIMSLVWQIQNDITLTD